MSEFALKAWTTSARTGDGRDDWTTPPELVEAIERLLGWSFLLDVACETHNVVAGAFGYTHDSGDDGLSKDWAADLAYITSPVQPVDCDSAAWCNPPYSTATDWLAKAHSAGCRVAVLVPARTDTRWWADYVMRPDGGRGAQQVIFLVGRVPFDGVNGAPFPSALVVYDPDVEGDGCECRTWAWKDDVRRTETERTQAALPLGG